MFSFSFSQTNKLLKRKQKWKMGFGIKPAEVHQCWPGSWLGGGDSAGPDHAGINHPFVKNELCRVQKSVFILARLYLKNVYIIHLYIPHVESGQNLLGKSRQRCNHLQELGLPGSCNKGLVSIPDFFHFFYAHTFSGLKILHSKVRKFATKIASRQNSVNQNWEVKFTLCVNLHTVCEITQYVILNTVCNSTQNV